MTGSSADEIVSRQFGRTNPDIRRFESTPVIIAELANGGLDAAIGDNGVIAYRVQEQRGLKTVADPGFPSEYFGIVVRQGNKALLDRLNAGLAAIKADGTYAKAYTGPVRPTGASGRLNGTGVLVRLVSRRHHRRIRRAVLARPVDDGRGHPDLHRPGDGARPADRHGPPGAVAAFPGRELCRYLLRWPSTVYVSFFRGTPLFVQILLMHFAVLPLFINPNDGWLICGEAARTIKQNHGAFISGVLALTLNAGAYISETFRAGIQSIDRGQVEAARSLGMSYWQSMRHVVLPQAFRACCRRSATTPYRC